MSVETTYHRPQSVEVACELLHDRPESIVVAGGQSLGLLTKEGIIDPEELVDITAIDELRGIECRDDELQFGATTTHRSVEDSPRVTKHCPVMHRAASHIADRQVRNAGTVGGVTAYADPTAEYPLVFLALDALIEAQSVDGTSTYRARDFFEGYYQCVLDDDELVTAVRVPTLGASDGAGYEKLAVRKNDRAVVNAVSWVRTADGTCTEAAVAVGSVAEMPILAVEATDTLVGTSLSDADVDGAATRARAEVPVESDPLYDDDYREAMIETLVAKTLRTARDSAMGGN